MVYASLILDMLPFHASEDFNSINCSEEVTKQSRDLVCVHVFIYNSLKSKLNNISRLKEPQCVCTTQLVRFLTVSTRSTEIQASCCHLKKRTCFTESYELKLELELGLACTDQS